MNVKARKGHTLIAEFLADLKILYFQIYIKFIETFILIPLIAVNCWFSITKYKAVRNPQLAKVRCIFSPKLIYI